jgi:hypothetical protein
MSSRCITVWAKKDNVYFIMSLEILRLFPQTFLPEAFPYGIQSYSILTTEELETVLSQTLANSSSTLNETCAKPLFYETSKLSAEALEIVSNKSIVSAADLRIFRFLGNYFQSLLIEHDGVFFVYSG